jgi:branched-chain amino acid transport system ATP-binding protein
MTVLKTDALTKRFGGVVALDQVTLQVDEKEILGVIGPNGSGKTTCFNVISGFYPPTSGRVIFGETDITGWPAHRISKLGLARTFQTTRPFLNLTVKENVIMGALGVCSDVEKAAEIAGKVLRETDLEEKAGRLGRDISIQDRKRLEVAKALSTSPKILLLDEPMAGLTEEEIRGFVGLVRQVREQAVTIILIEHIVKAVQELADRVIVLDCGRKICEGKPDEVVKNPDVLKAYLGEDTAQP